MKGPILLFSTLLSCSFSIGAYAQSDSLQHGGLTRYYLVHTPPSYNASTPLPLVIAMHGGFGSGPQLENQSQLSEKADTAQNPFIVVYPDGVRGTAGIRTWNAGGCCGYAMNNNIDDVGFLSSLLDTLYKDYAIDTSRVYATGMSNGGFMSYRLACELSERIAAIAPVASSMHLPACIPVRPVPIAHFHSLVDSNVPYPGGVGNGVSVHWNPPLDSVFGAWSVLNTCMVEDDTLVNGPAYRFRQWRECECGTTVDYYFTYDGGHSWPGGRNTFTGDTVSSALSANDLMWSFFQLHSLDCIQTGREELGSQSISMRVWPNPAGNWVWVEFEGDEWRGASLRLWDLMGRELRSFEDLSGNRLKLDLSGLGKGVYILEVSVNGLKAWERIVVE